MNAEYKKKLKIFQEQLRAKSDCPNVSDVSRPMRDLLIQVKARFTTAPEINTRAHVDRKPKTRLLPLRRKIVILKKKKLE